MTESTVSHKYKVGDKVKVIGNKEELRVYYVPYELYGKTGSVKRDEVFHGVASYVVEFPDHLGSWLVKEKHLNKQGWKQTCHTQ